MGQQPTIIEHEGKEYTPLEFQEFVAANLPEKHRTVVEITLRNIATYQESIKTSQKGIEDSVKLLVLLAAVEPVIKPLADYMKAEVDSLK